MPANGRYLVITLMMCIFCWTSGNCPTRRTHTTFTLAHSPVYCAKLLQQYFCCFVPTGTEPSPRIESHCHWRVHLKIVFISGGVVQTSGAGGLILVPAQVVLSSFSFSPPLPWKTNPLHQPLRLACPSFCKICFLCKGELSKTLELVDDSSRRSSEPDRVAACEVWGDGVVALMGSGKVKAVSGIHSSEPR